MRSAVDAKADLTCQNLEALFLCRVRVSGYVAAGICPDLHPESVAFMREAVALAANGIVDQLGHK